MIWDRIGDILLREILTDVCDDSVGEGHSTAGPSTLNHAQNEECRVVILDGESDVRDNVDGEADDVGWATAGTV